MKPIDQTKFGFPHGNCFSAAVASILDLTLDQCQIFSDGVDAVSEKDLKSGRHWWDVFKDWSHERDLHPIYLHTSELCGRTPKGYTVMSGTGPRGLDHSVVALNGVMVHDPHPSRAGLVTVKDFIVLIHIF